MIRTKADLKRYIAADRHAYGKLSPCSFKEKVIQYFFPDKNYAFVRCLRYLEYYTNTANLGVVKTFKRFYYALKLQRLKRQTGIDICPNTCGAGLHIVHGKVLVGANARIGENCKILSDVTVGIQGRYDRPQAPVIGNNVYIGTGARIIGGVRIADNVVIGANAVVTKSITESGTTWAGNPARKVSDTGSYHYLHRE